jgi:exo-beta-1,3-glucanase (GH17 family)
MTYIRLLAAILLAAIAAGAVWWFADRPVPVAAEWTQPLSSLSFAAYRHGESPMTGIYPTPAEVEQDMQILAGKTRGIRTYTTHEGLEGVPALAEKYGLKLTLGAWLGRDLANNEREIAALIQQANDHPESVQRVLVGNEVLLRNDLTPDQLIGYIRQVKAAIKQPVSTAEVVSFVLRYPQVGAELDYITVHILPFWDDYPLSVEESDKDTIDVIEQMRKTFPGKPILIGEIGWPSIGRDRGPAVVDVVNEADFVRRIANLAAQYDFDYNIVEAFDQPWKSALENTVGGAWGVMDADRAHGEGVLKFPMTGPVLRVADWHERALCAIALGTIATLLLARSLPTFSAMLVFAVAAQMLSWLMITTGFHVREITTRSWQYYWLVLRIGVPVLVLVAYLLQIKDRLAGVTGRNVWVSRLCVELGAVYALGWSVMLFYDGRYRDIPEFDFCLPVGGVLVLGVVNMIQGLNAREAWSLEGMLPGRHSRFTVLLGWALVAGALISVISEGWALAIGRDFVVAHPTFSEQLPYLLKGLVWNREMDLWSAMQLLWAAPFLLARPPQQASPSKPA